MAKHVAFLAVMILSSSALFAQTDDAKLTAALTVFDAWARQKIADERQPSIAVGIVQDQKLVWSKAYGSANVDTRQPATTRTLYRLGSVSKLFTATAIMQLRDARKLRLDDPVVKYLPSFRVKDPCAEKRNLRENGLTIECSDRKPITIIDLLTHSSGLPRESAASPYWNERQFPSTDEMLRALSQQEVLYEPATHYKYSNLALSLAGAIVEKVSGQRFDDYVQQHILGPLEMRDTRVVPRQDDPLLAVGYSGRVDGGDRKPRTFLTFNGLTPAASVTSNIEDMAKFISLQFRRGPAGGAQILAGSTLDEMHRLHFIRSDWKSGWGIGWGVRKTDSGVRIAHDGAVDGFRSRITIDPAMKVGVIVLANAEESNPTAYADQIFSYVAPLLAQHEAASPKIDPALAARYVGHYGFDEDTLDIVLIDGRLAMVTPDSDNAWDSRVMLEQITPTTFREIGGGTDGELLRFELGSDGKVARVWDAGFYWRPLKK